jgi:hypothetical protein
VAEIPETGFFTMEKVEKKKKMNLCSSRDKKKKKATHQKKTIKIYEKNNFDMQITVNA